jgi:hypothetical protein
MDGKPARGTLAAGCGANGAGIRVVVEPLVSLLLYLYGQVAKLGDKSFAINNLT